MCSLNPVNTRQDIDQTVADLVNGKPRTILCVTSEQATGRDRILAEGVRGAVEYARFRKLPGVTVHPDGVIEIPE